MLDQLKNEANLTFTENGALTNRSTGADCLDLFATIGALRHASDDEIVTRFVRAFTENKDIAMKLLFFARDVRSGLGERKVFRVILKHLAHSYPSTVIKNLPYVAEFGRYDDLLALMDTPCEKDAFELIKTQLCKDKEAMAQGGEISLLAKWLPSVNASNENTVLNAKKIARYLDMNDAQYRKTLSAMRSYIKIIENNLREKDYTFDYEKQPSKAMFKYRKAFMRNDGERYTQFLDKVTTGEAKLNAKNVYPYELIQGFYETHDIDQLSQEERASLNATWNSLPDYGSDENILAVIDTSGSMYCCNNPTPASVAFSLGLYCAERNKGRFANHFITFSSRPQLLEIKGDTFVEKLRYLMTFSEIADTNIEATFMLILNTALKHKLPQEELPSKLIIISDMEFNYCARNAGVTNFQNAKKMFEENGYKLPEIVFWNVASRNQQQPVTINDRGVALVSGCTPRLFSMVAGGIVDPYAFMLEVINNERYALITA